MTTLGIMSGTSIDSVDYALCSVGKEPLALLAHWQVKFPRALRQRLHEAAQGAARAYEVAQLHHDLGRFYARHASSRWLSLAAKSFLPSPVVRQLRAHRRQ